MAVDAFDAVAVLGIAPEWFHTLDVLAAIGYTIIIICLGTCVSIRYN